MYDKSENSRSYNRNERGGWYCTNPRKHDDAQLHHRSDEPHNHTAERNDGDTARHPDSRQTRIHTPGQQSQQERVRPFVEPKQSTSQSPQSGSPTTQRPTSKKSKGCTGCSLFFLIFFAILGKCAFDETEYTDYDYDYDYEYEEAEADTLFEVTTHSDDTVELIDDASTDDMVCDEVETIGNLDSQSVFDL